MASDPPLLGSSTGGSSCCGRHHLLWRGLLIAFAVMISVLLMTLCIIRRENGGGHSGNDTKKICLTPGCVFAANEVLRHMKPEVNPCNNFYEFACGHFINETIIPDDKTSVTALDLIDDKLTDQLRMIIEERVRVNETRPLRMAKELYNSCMNQTRIEEIGLSHMQKMIKRLGGWPVLEGVQWNSTLFTWSNTTYKLRDEGFSIDSLIKLSVEPDSKNSTKRVIVLDQASLSLSLENLEKDKYLVEKLHSYMVDVAVMFRANPDRAYTELNESLEFQIKLANISLRPEERRNSTELYNPMTILELQKKFPSIPWYEYISAILPKSVQVQLNETVIVAVPSYISGLEVLLRITPKRVQANYLLWRAVESVVSHLTASLRERQLQYYKTLSGLTESGPRWKHCVHLSADRFVLPVGALYVKRFFKPEAKKNVLEMVDNLREEMYRILQTVDWMDNNTRKNALMKAKSMVSYIAYPDELLDVSKVEDYYRKLEISGGNFLKAVLNFSKFHLDTMLSELHQPINKTGWIQHATPAMVNAFYNPSENSIMFPAGILQGNVYSFDRPNYMNYAALGFVIGHEITHGFDDEGSQYDQDGDLVDWWAPETRNTYLKKAQCIIDQYSNYTSEQVGLKLNGVNTQGENIADNGGIKQAYRAYNRWVQTHGEEKRLPGLQDFTPQQMFWVSAANTWCSKYRPETLKLRIITGQHSPGEFRVRGPLSNRPEFARDFKCPSGSKMNPGKKCQVW